MGFIPLLGSKRWEFIWDLHLEFLKTMVFVEYFPGTSTESRDRTGHEPSQGMQKLGISWDMIEIFHGDGQVGYLTNFCIFSIFGFFLSHLVFLVSLFPAVDYSSNERPAMYHLALEKWCCQWQTGMTK